VLCQNGTFLEQGLTTGGVVDGDAQACYHACAVNLYCAGRTRPSMRSSKASVSPRA
jgi:hypothetical protein